MSPEGDTPSPPARPPPPSLRERGSAAPEPHCAEPAPRRHLGRGAREPALRVRAGCLSRGVHGSTQRGVPRGGRSSQQDAESWRRERPRGQRRGPWWGPGHCLLHRLSDRATATALWPLALHWLPHVHALPAPRAAAGSGPCAAARWPPAPRPTSLLCWPPYQHFLRGAGPGRALDGGADHRAAQLRGAAGRLLRAPGALCCRCRCHGHGCPKQP